MSKHHPRFYSVIKHLKGQTQVVFVASCGPCGIAKYFHTADARDRELEAHQ